MKNIRFLTIIFWVSLLCLLSLTLITISTLFRTNGKITSEGRIRRYLLHVPDSYDPEQPTPLVISLHGFVQWPAHQQNMSGWNEVADEHGFLIVYPQGTGFPLRWHSRQNNHPRWSNTNDLQFILDLLDHLSQSYNIDQERIYANGMSNGAGMSDLLACELSGRIAAIGGVAGSYLYPREDCHPDHPIPVIAFHGLDDPIVPYSGGMSRDNRFEFFPC